MIHYKNKVVVITGGSAGIGLATAHEMALQGAIVNIIARGAQQLHEAKQQLLTDFSALQVETYAADVSNEEEITAVIHTIGTRYGTIDLLINCAGMVTCGRFSDQPNSDLRRIMEINYMGSVYASKAAWAYLKKARGQLSFVSSVAGFFGVAGYSSYSPSKFALTGLAEVLRWEATADNINISIIYPPNTDTTLLDFSKKNNIPECIALSSNIKTKTTSQVAKIYVKGLQKNTFEIYCDRKSKMLRWVKNNFPALSFTIGKLIIKRTLKALKKKDQ